MAGTTRTRTKENFRHGVARRFSPTGNPVYYVQTVNQVRSWPTFRDVCTDVVGDRRNDHSLTISKEIWDMQGLNGRDKNLGYREYSEYPGSYFDGYIPKHAANLGLPSEAVALTEALARADPDRAEVDLPIAVAELREVPGLIKDYGDLIFKKIRRKRYKAFTDSARQNLAWEFGLEPMIKDLQRLMDFVTLVENRRKEIERLYEEGGLRKRIDLQRKFVKTEHLPKRAIDSILSDVIYRDLTRITVVDRWATFRFKPSRPTLPPTDSAMEALALKAIFGLKFDAVTAWNLIPFSWLLGWFSTTESYIQSMRNVIPCYCDSGCLMTTVSTTERYANTPKSVDFARGCEGTIRLVTKRRYVSTNPVLQASIGFIDWRKTSILGSLAISRSSRLANSL